MVPTVSVIILNHNGRRWLSACFDAVLAQRGAVAFETLLVDNASTDDSVALTRGAYPAVRIVESGTNLGFAGGNNLGAREARGGWLAFLNNDTVPDLEWLSALVAATAAHREFAILTSRLVYLDNPRLVDSAGDGYYRAGGAFKRGHGEPVEGFTDSREVFGACGGAFLIRREAFEALGGFDERFFMIYEDVDLSYRARLRGLRVWYAADAVVRHAGSGSLGTASPAAVYVGQRNLEWTWIKNTPAGLLARTALPHVVYSLAGVAHYIRIGRGGPAVRGKLAALGGLTRILAERRTVQASRTVAVTEIERVMEPRWFHAKRREKAFTSTRVIAQSRERPSQSRTDR